MPRYYSAVIEIDITRFEAYAKEHQINIGIEEACWKIDDVFNKHNISKIHGHYKGECDITPAVFFKVLVELNETLDWFKPCIKNARIMRVEDDDDMMEFFS